VESCARTGGREKKGVCMRKEVKSMITTLKITRLTIDKVAKVEIEKLPSVEEFEFCQRSVAIWTEQGEKIELILEAASAKSLEFVEESDWLTPTLYKPEKE
jgi:hypothetical protein